MPGRNLVQPADRHLHEVLTAQPGMQLTTECWCLPVNLMVAHLLMICGRTRLPAIPGRNSARLVDRHLHAFLPQQYGMSPIAGCWCLEDIQEAAILTICGHTHLPEILGLN